MKEGETDRLGASAAGGRGGEIDRKMGTALSPTSHLKSPTEFQG